MLRRVVTLLKNHLPVPLHTNTPQIITRASKSAPPRIYPDASIPRLLALCQSKEEFSSNLLFRSNAILETPDAVLQREMVSTLQTEIFVTLQASLAGNDDRIYHLYAAFSRQILRSTSPALRDRHAKFLTNLLIQPCLRLSFARQDVLVNPNKVLQAMGAANFLRFRHALLLDLRRLSEKSIGLVFDRIGKVTLDLVRFAFDVSASPESLEETIGTGWTFRRILDSVCQRQSAELLGFFFSRCEHPEFREQARQFLVERDEFTGLPLRPWALEVGRSGIAESIANTFPRLTSHVARKRRVDDVLADYVSEITSEGSGKTLSDDAVFYVDSAAKVAAMFRRISDVKQLAMSWFPGDRDNHVGLFVFATTEAAFVVDVLSAKVSRDFGLFATLNFAVDHFMTSEATKYVFARESLIDAVGDFRGDADFEEFSAEHEIAAKNLVDVRRPWVKRSLVEAKARTAVEQEQALADAKEDVEKFRKLKGNRPDENVTRLVENTEFFPGYVPLSAMCERFLDFSVRNLRRESDLWANRPLPAWALLEVAAETQALLLISEEMNRRGFVPVEVMDDRAV